MCFEHIQIQLMTVWLGLICNSWDFSRALVWVAAPLLNIELFGTLKFELFGIIGTPVSNPLKILSPKPGTTLNLIG